MLRVNELFYHFGGSERTRSNGDEDGRSVECLFAERFGSSREDLRDAEWLGEISRDAEIDCLDRARLGRKAGDDDDWQIRFVALGFADHGEAVHPRHLQIRDKQIVWIDAHA